jgi:hypothetical protein
MENQKKTGKGRGKAGKRGRRGRGRGRNLKARGNSKPSQSLGQNAKQIDGVLSLEAKKDEVCRFFLKFGNCRDGETCKNIHPPLPDSGQPCRPFIKNSNSREGQACKNVHPGLFAPSLPILITVSLRPHTNHHCPFD